MNDTDRAARLQALTDLLYEAAAEAGAEEPGGARILAETEALHSGSAVIVCVGEKKRGKSSLINALTGCPGLLPVDIDVASSVHVLVRYGERPEALVHRGPEGGPSRAEPVPLERIAEFAALDPETQLARHQDVSHLDVSVPAEVLRPGLVLVDTPGVGGLVSGHAQLTMAALRRADALLFVLDGSGELTDSELAFLEKATDRIATVVFVLTKTDKYLDWREVLERDRDLVREHAPRYADAPWFAVSAAEEEDAVAAEEAGDPEKAARLRASGGCGELGSALVRMIAERAVDVRMGNVAQVIHGELVPLAEQARRMLTAASGGTEGAAEVERLQETLAREKTEGAIWRKSLAKRTKSVEEEIQLAFKRSVNDLRSAAGDEIAKARRTAERTNLPESLERGVRAVWAELEAALEVGVRGLVEETGREIEAALGGAAAARAGQDLARGGPLTGGGPALRLPDRLRDLKRPAPTAHDQQGPGAFLERSLLAWSGGSVVFGITTVITGGALLGPLMMGAGVIGALMTRRRRRGELVRVRGDARRHLSQTVAELTTEVPPVVKGIVADASSRLAGSITLVLEERETELRAELKELRAVLAQEKAERTRQAAESRARQARIVGLLDRLRSLVPEAGPTGRGAQ
ncbi:dynamin family protein [Streptomyces virginiae]|uniref:dynamin family protein n=1 Tax=Streptomyces virginiae TaxID=1961 RepID=UPI003246BE36